MCGNSKHVCIDREILTLVRGLTCNMKRHIHLPTPLSTLLQLMPQSHVTCCHSLIGRIACYTQRKTFARRIYVRAKISHLLCKRPPIVYAHLIYCANGRPYLINSFIVQTAAHSIHTRAHTSWCRRTQTDRQTDKLITITSQTLRVGELNIYICRCPYRIQQHEDITL